MNSIYASQRLKQEIWQGFISHFKSEITVDSYRTDIEEIMNMFQKDFLELTERDVAQYYEHLQKKIKEGILQPITVSKKMREAHSLADYIVENREKYSVDYSFNDWFYPYLKLVAKQEKYVNTIPIQDIDLLLQTAKNDIMAYCIITLLYRVGLSSTEITRLKPEDFAAYDNGVYAVIDGRRESCFIPEDVFVVLENYLQNREENEYLFYNQRGNPLNTMYISRLMKKYTLQAGIPAYSAENIRNTCAVTMFAYGASPEQVAGQMGITKIQIKRYKNVSYKENLIREANALVKLKVEPPEK